MTGYEIAFLALVIGALTVFSVALAWVTQYTNSGRTFPSNSAAQIQPQPGDQRRAA